MSQSEGVLLGGGMNQRGGETLSSDVSSSLVAAAHELKSPLVLIRQLALASQDNTRSDAERFKAEVRA